MINLKKVAGRFWLMDNEEVHEMVQNITAGAEPLDWALKHGLHRLELNTWGGVTATIYVEGIRPLQTELIRESFHDAISFAIILIGIQYGEITEDLVKFVHPTGVIKDVEYTNGSGGITLVLEDGTRLMGDQGMTIRAFDDMLGDVIGADHSFDPDKIIGTKIKYIEENGFMTSVDLDED